MGETGGKRWREKNGRLIHDGDCHFWSAKVCTCGLLHHLMPSTVHWPEWFMDEMVEQDRQFEVLRTHRRNKRTQEQAGACDG